MGSVVVGDCGIEVSHQPHKGKKNGTEWTCDGHKITYHYVDDATTALAEQAVEALPYSRQRQIDRTYAYANACSKIRHLMHDATHRRKHKSLVSVVDLNDALMAFGLTIDTINNDLAREGEVF